MAPFPVELFDAGPGYLGNLRGNIYFKTAKIPDLI